MEGVDSSILDPRDTYEDPKGWKERARDLGERFILNFKKYERDERCKRLSSAGPVLGMRKAVKQLIAGVILLVAAVIFLGIGGYTGSAPLMVLSVLLGLPAIGFTAVGHKGITSV